MAASITDVTKKATDKALEQTQRGLSENIAKLNEILIKTSKEQFETKTAEKKGSLYAAEKTIRKLVSDISKATSDKDIERITKNIEQISKNNEISTKDLETITETYNLMLKKMELTKKTEKTKSQENIEKFFNKMTFLPEFIRAVPEKMYESSKTTIFREIELLSEIMEDKQEYLSTIADQLLGEQKRSLKFDEDRAQSSVYQLKAQHEIFEKLGQTFFDLKKNDPSKITKTMEKFMKSFLPFHDELLAKSIDQFAEAQELGDIEAQKKIAASIQQLQSNIVDKLNKNIKSIQKLNSFADDANKISEAQLNFAKEKSSDEELAVQPQENTLEDIKNILSKMSKPGEVKKEEGGGWLDWILLIGIGLTALVLSFKDSVRKVIQDMLLGFIAIKKVLSYIKIPTFFSKITEKITEFGSKIGSTFSKAFTFLEKIPFIGKYITMIGKTFSMFSKLGTVLGKLAWPLTAIFSIFDFYKGFTDTKSLSKKLGKKEEDITGFDKAAGGITSVLNGLTFGILGKFDKNGEITGAISSGLEWITNLFVNMWDGIKTFAKNTWNSIAPIFEKITSFFDLIWTNIKKAYTEIEPKILNIWNSIKEIFSLFVENLMIAWNKISEVLQPFVAFLSTVLSKQLSLLWQGLQFIGKIISDITEFAFKNLIIGLQTLWAIIEPIAIFILDVVVNAFELLWNILKEFVNNVLDTFSGILEGVKQILSGNFLNGINKIFESILGGIYNMFMGVWNSASIFLFDSLGSLIANVVAIWDNLIELFKENFFSLKDSVIKIFADVVNGIWSLVAGMWNSIVTSLAPYLSKIGIEIPTLTPTIMQAKETGGRFSQNPLLVGEAGPELIFPDFSGRVANARDTERIISSKEKIIEKSVEQSGQMYDNLGKMKETNNNLNMPIINNSNTFVNSGNKNAGATTKVVLSGSIFDKLYDY